MGIAGAIVGGAVIGGVGTAIGASSAAHAQENAADKASATQLQMYNQTRSDLAPYQAFGQQGGNQLMARLGDLTQPFSMTQAQLEQTPGYQFNLSQGLKATNNALGARGLLNSGAVMKGAASYATGLADSTYQNQFNMDQAQKTNAYNKLLGVTQLGENAAAQTGAYGTQTAQQIGQNTIGAGNAAAASYNAMGSAVGNIGNSIGNAALINKYGAGIFGA
jgi:hypothetical protein